MPGIKNLIVYYIYLFCRERTYLSGGSCEDEGAVWGGQFSFPPCESVNKHLYQPGYLTGSRKIFFLKKNNLYFKKDRKDKEKTKQNTSGGLLTPAFAPPP